MSALVDIALASLAAIGTGMLLQKAYEKFDYYPPEPVYLAAVGLGAWAGLRVADKIDQKIQKTMAGLGALVPTALNPHAIPLHSTTGFMPGFNRNLDPMSTGPADAVLNTRIFANS